MIQQFVAPVANLLETPSTELATSTECATSMASKSSEKNPLTKLPVESSTGVANEHLAITITELQKKLATDEKNLANTAYKKKDFSSALKHYDNAIGADPSNIDCYMNKGAVLLVQEKFEECIEVCVKAVEVGRENNADEKVLARAFARVGNACMKRNDFKNAVIYFNNSLRKYRDPAVVKERDKAEIAAREKGITVYKMAPVKLTVKGYIGKGDILMAMKKPAEAAKAFQAALDVAPDDAEALDGFRRATTVSVDDPEFAIKKAVSKGTVFNSMFGTSDTKPNLNQTKPKSKPKVAQNSKDVSGKLEYRAPEKPKPSPKTADDDSRDSLKA